MPTENRSCNTEMVSVPRDEVERLVKLLAYQAHPYPSPHAEYWQSVLDQPVQHQGEPVAVLYANGTVLTKADCGDVFDICCKVETPLYTHADPNVRWEAVANEQVKVIDGLRADSKWLRDELDKALLQLAEAHALLREAYEDGFRDGDRCHERGDHFGEAMESGWLASDACKALSASAEPSAPCITPIGQRCPGDGVSRCKACPQVPVEIDERAGFEAYALDKGWLSQHLKQRPDGNYEDWGVNPEWQAWKARAALERKPQVKS